VQAVGMALAVGFFFSFRLFIMLLSVRILGTDPQTGVEVSLARALGVCVSFFLLLQSVVDEHSIAARGDCLLVRDGCRCRNCDPDSPSGVSYTGRKFADERLCVGRMCRSNYRLAATCAV